MTRFLDTIKAYQCDDKVELSRIKPLDMLSVYQTIEATSNIEQIYTIETRFRVTQRVSPELVDNSVDHIRQEIAEFVYGDVTKELIEWFSNLRYNNNVHHEDCVEFYKILNKMR